MRRNGFKILLAALILSLAFGAIAESAQTIKGKPLGDIDDVVKEVAGGELSIPKEGLITLRGGDKIDDVDIYATTFAKDASASTKRLYHNSNATSTLNWTANSPYYLRPAVSRKLYNGKRVLMTHNLAHNGKLKYYFKTLSNNRREEWTNATTTPKALVDSVQISDFGEYKTATFSNVENYHVMEVYGTGVMSVKGYDREIFVGASGAARSLTTHQNGGYQRVWRPDNEVRLEFFAISADSEGKMSQEPLTELKHETPYRGDPSLAIISLAVGDIDGDKYDNEVVLMITTLNEIRFFVYRLTLSDGKLTLRSLGDASGRLVHATDQWDADLERQPVGDMAVGDFDGDGRDEIAVIFKFSERATALANDKGWKRGPMTGSVHCRVFQWNTTKKAFDVAGTIQKYNKEELVDSATNMAPSAKVAGVVGIRATAADLDGDGKDEIVTLLLGYYHGKQWDSKLNPGIIREDFFYVFPHLAVWTFNRGSIKPVHDDAHIMGGGKASAGDHSYGFSWLNEHSANTKGLLLSDTEPFLKYERSWQQGVFMFVSDPTESVTGTNPDDLTHMYALVDFSIAAGPFTGTLGNFTTVDDIAVSWKRNGEDRVTVFKTKLNSAKQFDGFEDGKLVLQEKKTGGTWRGLVAADIAGEGVELDKPVHIRQESNRNYIAVLNAVPYHVDNVSADGTALQTAPHNFTYSEALNGGNMTVSYGKSTTTNESNTVQQDLSQSIETMFLADPTATDTKVQSTFGTVKGLVGFASAIGEIVHGVKVDAMSTEEKQNAVWKPESPTAGLTEMMDFLTDKVDSIDKRTNTETSSTTIDKEITATTHDAILYTNTARHIWRYPVMTRPLPMWLAYGPRIDSTPLSSDQAKGDKELYMTFTMSENSALNASSSVADSLYQPLHEEGNFFSYPPSVAGVEGYNEAGLLIETEDTWDFSNNMSDTGIRFTKATSNMQHTEKTVTPSAFTSTISFFDRLFNGDKATGVKMPESENPKTFSKEYSKNERISYNLQGSSLLTGSTAGHQVRMQPFVAKEGAMTLGTAVRLKTDGEELWANTSVYQQKPDPALLLPKKFLKRGTDFVANTYDPSAMSIRGIRFYAPDFAFYSDNRLVNGLTYEIRVPLYNASFKDTGDFKVRLSYTTDDSPTAKRTQIGKDLTMNLGGWDNDKNNNKGTAVFTWAPDLTANKKAENKKYYFYVEIDPDNDLNEVHEERYGADGKISDYGGNNTGFYPFYVYDYDDSGASVASASGGVRVADDEIHLEPLTFKDGDGEVIDDLEKFIDTRSQDSFVTMTAEFDYDGPEVSHAYLVGYVLTKSGKTKLPTASINTIVNLNDLESDDVSEVFMVEDLALFNGTNKVTFTFSPAELIAETKDIDSDIAESATFGILTLTDEELQSVEEFFEGNDPYFELDEIADYLVSSSTSQTYTLTADENVFWNVSSVKLSETVSTSDEDDDADFLDITLDCGNESEAAPSNYGKTATVTVSSIAGCTPKGVYEITVEKLYKTQAAEDADPEEFTDSEVIMFDVADKKGEDIDSGNTESGGENPTPTTFETISDTAKTNFAKPAVKSVIEGKLKEALGDKAANYPFKSELPDNAVSPNTPKSVTADELADAVRKGGSGKPKSFDIAPLTFPTVSVDEAGIYPLGAVPTTNIVKGMKLFIYMLVVDETAGTVTLSDAEFFNMKVAADSTEGAFFTNDAGDPITEVPEGLDVNIWAPLDAGTEYTPVVALAEADDSTLGSSSSGCEVGISALGLGILFAALIIRRKAR